MQIRNAKMKSVFVGIVSECLREELWALNSCWGMTG